MMNLTGTEPTLALTAVRLLLVVVVVAAAAAVCG